jgi:hypothetical protein
MTSGSSVARQWLRHEDKTAFEERLSRLKWIEASMPMFEFQLFPGGYLSKSLFEEMRYCYVYGQYLAVVVLGLGFVERVFASDLYAANRSDLERASPATLMREELARDVISQDEFEILDRARSNRNTVVHLRSPGHPESMERRPINRGELPYALFEEDARNVISIVFQLLRRWRFSL